MNQKVTKIKLSYLVHENMTPTKSQRITSDDINFTIQTKLITACLVPFHPIKGYTSFENSCTWFTGLGIYLTLPIFKQARAS
jgi:hypothetical protein